MYINSFVAGVIATVFAELLIVVGAAVVTFLKGGED